MQKICSASGNQGQKIYFDEFLVSFKLVLFRKRDRIMVGEDSEEENACERQLDEMHKAPASTKKKDNNPMLIFQFFQKLDDGIVFSYSTFDIKHLNESKNEDSST